MRRWRLFVPQDQIEEDQGDDNLRSPPEEEKKEIAVAQVEKHVRIFKPNQPKEIRKELIQDPVPIKDEEQCLLEIQMEIGMDDESEPDIFFGQKEWSQRHRILAKWRNGRKFRRNDILTLSTVYEEDEPKLPDTVTEIAMLVSYGGALDDVVIDDVVIQNG